jgi:CMP/dCMP kinase
MKQKNFNMGSKSIISSVPVITVDGPTASGKGTIGQKLATALGWHFLDSGALYRVLALAALQRNIKPNDRIALESLAANLDVEFIDKKDNNAPQIKYAGMDVTEAIRQEGCGIFASQIAVIPEVRVALWACQQQFRVAPGLVADGRDMGTVVFKDAILKIFLTASSLARAKRRQQQLQEKAINVSLREVQLDLEERDARDAKRAAAPLKPADDAVIIDTTNLSIDEVLQQLLQKVQELLNAPIK